MVVGYGPELDGVCENLGIHSSYSGIRITHVEVFETLFYSSFAGISLIEFQWHISLQVAIVVKSAVILGGFRFKEEEGIILCISLNLKVLVGK